jgi:hypothetical protein
VKVSLEQHDKNKPKNRYVNERIGGTLQRLSSCPICGGNLTFLKMPSNYTEIFASSLHNEGKRHDITGKPQD